MGEAVLGVILPMLLEKLADREVLEYFGRVKGVDKKVLQKWTQTLTAIEAVLSDAEEKQLTQRGVKEWLDDLTDLAYDAQDILDIFDTKMLKRRIQGQQGRKTKLWISSLVSEAKSNVSLNSAIKHISDRLDELTAREKQFGLKNLGVSKKPWKMPLTTCQLDGPVIGRDEAKTTILDKLLSEQEHCTSTSQNYHVVAIVGTGGLGKTTLAKHVFNNAKTDQFSAKGWVCVSDDFDILRVTLAILESVTSAPVQDLKELNTIQETLSKELAGKKFLIVLDDVWRTCSYSQWTTLQSSFCFGAAGSRIIVTTRDSSVADRMGDNNPYRLESMSADDCWKIFEHHALLNNRPQDVEFLKEKIVMKCSGLPLAASTLGGLLRCKRIDEWEAVLDHKMWDQVDILPALKLSYHYLPSNLKRCFSYCAILPYDYEFEEMQLILWWMAEGLILQQPGGNRQMEDLGRDYFQELVSRKFMFKAGGYENSDSQSRCLVRHSSYICGKCDGVEKFGFYSEGASLRTFLPLSLSNSNDTNNYLAHKVISELLPKLQYLRLLSLSGYIITELPDTIGKLKHLRYLNVSHTRIRSLPDSTTTLYNLQTLILKNCGHLKALPTGMKNLVNLRHLNNSGTHSLKEMPPQLGQLTNLQTLPSFVIGKGGGSGVGEIGSLLHLQGTLRLSRLENVTCVEDARSANLKSKERLEALLLEWSSSVSTEEAACVLGVLQPHSKLKELTIKGYAGLKFPTWIGDSSFSNMVYVWLEGCSHCQFLPPFGQLTALRELIINEMDAVETVGLEFYGNCMLPFQALETLAFYNLKNWKEWSPCQQNDGVRVFSCLKKLSIKDCPKLEGDLPENVDSLTRLEICGCQELVVSVSNYNQLQESKIENCKMVDSLLQHLNSLGRLHIEDNSALVEKLGEEAERLLQLQILDCKIERLELSKCGSLLKVPKGLHHLTSLQELHINKCSSLVSLPDAGLPPGLQVIKIQKCDSLLQFAKYQIPPSLKRITIWNCEHLTSLVEKEEVGDGGSSFCLLELLDISDCPSLIALLRKGQLPRALKQLEIYDCGQLELIAERFLDDTWQLEKIDIRECPNLKFLPEGLCHLTNLQSLIINNCQSVVSLPRMSVWPRRMSILSCEKLEVSQLLRDMMHSADSVKVLEIDCCEGLTTSSFPPSLTSLAIYKIKNCKALMESQVLQRLTSLIQLRLYGEDDGGLVSFPPGENTKDQEMLLPRSLVLLGIGCFPNLKKLSKGIQFLTSLEILGMTSCPNLATLLPVEDGLPHSLTQLVILGCPLLEERYKGRYRNKIAHIPCVLTDWVVI